MSESLITDLEARYAALTAHIEDMNPNARDEALSALTETPALIADWVNAGKAALTYMAVSADTNLHIVQDSLGQTALHKAAGDHSGLLVYILTRTPNAAPFIEDYNHNKPLDLAGRQANKYAVKLLFPLTFPSLYLEPELQVENGIYPEPTLSAYRGEQIKQSGRNSVHIQQSRSHTT